MDFITLVSTTYREMGYSGTGPTTVVGNTGQSLKVVEAVRAADNYVQMLWSNWKFLWREFSAVTVDSSFDLNPERPPYAGPWDERSFVFDRRTANIVRPQFIDYAYYRDTIAVRETYAAEPEFITEKPDGTLAIWPYPDKEYAFNADYWRTPSELGVNSDISLIPERFHRVIVAYAEIMLAMQEDAPEILQTANAEFADLLDKLESDQLPGQRVRRQSEATIPVVVESVGYESDYWQ